MVTASAEDRTSQSIGLDRVLEVWWRRKWVAVITFVTIFPAAVSFAIWIPNQYRATATVLVETQHVSEEFVRSSVTSELGTRIQRIRQEVMSRGRLGTLVTQLDLYRDLRDKGVALDTVIERMRRDVDLELTGVDPQTGGRGPTIAFTLTYSGRDPETVAHVANTLASLYVEENAKMRTGEAARTAQFLKLELAEAKRELDEQERRTSSFKLSHIGELPQQVEANISSLERLNTQLRLNSETQIRAMDRRDRLESELADAGTVTTPRTETASPNAAQLTRLRAELQQLRQQFSDAYPEVVRVKREIAALEQLKQEDASPDAAAPSRQDSNKRLTLALSAIDAELRALKDEEQQIRRSIALLEQRVENAPKREDEYQAIARDYASTKDRHDTLLKRYEEAQLGESLERGKQAEQFRILDPAIPPKNPSGPPRMRLLAAGLALSILLAVGAVIIIEKFDTSFHDIDDLQRAVRAVAAGTMLFSIPRIETAAGRRRTWRRVALTTAAVLIGLAMLVAGVRYVTTESDRFVRLVASGRG